MHQDFRFQSNESRSKVASSDVFQDRKPKHETRTGRREKQLHGFVLTIF